MKWCDFYDRFFDWSDGTRRSKISSLEDIGSGCEVTEAILDTTDEAVKAQLIRKAMKLGVVLTAEDFMNLDGEFTEELYEQVGRYAGFDAENPYFDENAMSWEDFYGNYSDWDEELMHRRIEKLQQFGSADEMCEVIASLVNEADAEKLYQKAVDAGVVFTSDQKEEMGRWDEWFRDENWPVSDEEMDAFSTDVQTLCDRLDAPPSPRFSGKKSLLALFLALLGGEQKKSNPKSCNGDCANCPAHYGYRYGRWYYGHGHQYGCLRGGNGGAGRRK